MFNLNGESNIHHGNTAVAAKQQSAPSFRPRVRKVQRTPAEEMSARMKKHGATERVPDGLAAIILFTKKSVDVQADGIKFRYENRQHHFFSPDSVVCHPSNIGKPISFVFNRHDLSVIYALDDAGRFIEAVPMATHPEMFDKQMETVLRETRRVTTHIHEALKKDHRIDTARAAQQSLDNREKMQFANAFPAPCRSENTASIESADRLQDEINGVAAHRQDITDLRSRLAEREQSCRVTETDRLAAFGEKRESGGEVSAEEMEALFRVED